MEEKTLQVLLIRENDWWVAQCLEYDIAAQSKGGLKEAVEEFCEMLVSRAQACEKENLDPLNLPKAPSVYWDMAKTAPKLEFDREPICMMPRQFTTQLRLAA